MKSVRWMENMGGLLYWRRVRKYSRDVSIRFGVLIRLVMFPKATEWYRHIRLTLSPFHYTRSVMVLIMVDWTYIIRKLCQNRNNTDILFQMGLEKTTKHCAKWLMKRIEIQRIKRFCQFNPFFFVLFSSFWTFEIDLIDCFDILLFYDWQDLRTRLPDHLNF